MKNIKHSPNSSAVQVEVQTLIATLIVGTMIIGFSLHYYLYRYNQKKDIDIKVQPSPIDKLAADIYRLLPLTVMIVLILIIYKAVAPVIIFIQLFLLSCIFGILFYFLYFRYF